MTSFFAFWDFCWKILFTHDVRLRCFSKKIIEKDFKKHTPLFIKGAVSDVNRTDNTSTVKQASRERGVLVNQSFIKADRYTFFTSVYNGKFLLINVIYDTATLLVLMLVSSLSEKIATLHLFPTHPYVKVPITTANVKLSCT